MDISLQQILDLRNRVEISHEAFMAQVGLAQVVLVGEEHDNPAHHEVQLETIRHLFEQHPDLAVGMEMFPHPLQPVLDQWVAGGLQEEAFLDAVEWYYTWGFDAELYLPILRFVRDQKIPLLALNIPREVVRQVRMQGLESLEAKVRESLPPLAFASHGYRLRLQKVFDAHPMFAQSALFDNFVQAQQIWDGVMADRLRAWLQDHPDGHVVGVVGGGHIWQGHGIPHQLASRGVTRVVTVLPWSRTEPQVQADVADFVIGTPATPESEDPVQLGVVLQNKEGGILIEKILPDTPASHSELAVQDRIKSFDGQEIQARHTLVRLVRGKHWGDRVSMTVQRADGEHQLTIILEKPAS
ncbi:MAG: ChaN family lipoprotein [Magnetococcus sp. DMHC-6]